MHLSRIAPSVAIAVFAALGSGHAQSSTAPAAPVGLSTGAMVDCSGLPCVDVTVAGGKHLRLALDTGNPTSILSTKAASSLGLQQEPYVGRDGKPVPGFMVEVLPSVVVGSGSLGDLKFAVADLSDAISKGTFPAVDGTLAYGVFKNRILQLNYRDKAIGYSAVLTDALPCPVTECGKIGLIPFGKQGPPIVTTTGFTVNGKPLDVQVDTMFSGTLLVFPTAVAKLGLSAESESKVTRYFPFTDEGVDMTKAESVTEGFGGVTLASKAPVYFAGPKVHLPDGLFDGTVGAELFASHRLTLDFKSLSFWMD